MRNIGNYISDLLFDHNCVVIPNLGGFIANVSASHIDLLSNKFYPPNKSIGFNKELSTNDGLLASIIAKQEQIEYDKAVAFIEQQVVQIHHNFTINQLVVLDNIGTLFQNKDGNIQFEPITQVNFSRHSFGLTPISVPKLATEKEEPKIIPLVVPSTVIIEKETVSSFNYKKLAIAAALIPFITYLFWLPTQTDIFKTNGNFAMADLVPFTKKVCPVYTYTPFSINPDIITQNHDPFGLLKAEKLQQPIAIALFESNEPYYDAHKLIPVKFSKLITAIESTSVQNMKPKHRGKFNIIGGCFSVYKNAQKFIKKLNQRGFNASVVDMKNGLYRVSYNSYDSARDARKALATIQGNINSKAWLLIN